MIGRVICAAVVVLFYFAFDLIYPPRGLLLRDWIRGIDRIAAWIPPLWPLPLTRRGKLDALRTMELWAWWSWLRRNLMGEAEWIGSNGKNHGALPDAARFATEHLAPSSRWPVNWSRPALRMSYTRIDSSAYLFLDKFDRRQVEWFYADNVGGYTREEVAEMIK